MTVSDPDGLTIGVLSVSGVLVLLVIVLGYVAINIYNKKVSGKNDSVERLAVFGMDGKAPS